jgi:hypothetical protein
MLEASGPKLCTYLFGYIAVKQCTPTGGWAS